MKDKKGFTLVELLAVIVVLGIIVGIAIPITNNIISNSKYESLKVMVDEAEKFVGDQWKLKKVDSDSMTDAFEKVLKELEDLEYIEDSEGEKYLDFLELNVTNHRGLIEEMGIPSEDVETVFIQVDDNNIPCVFIASIPSNSKIFEDIHWNKIDYNKEKIVLADDGINQGYYSKCCIPGWVQTKYNAWFGDKYGE